MSFKQVINPIIKNRMVSEVRAFLYMGLSMRYKTHALQHKTV
jgi:hypothetical protein